jgi:hypothetical protein
MISDTNEKTEPAPLTEREMNQFVTLAAMPTLERALDRLRWLEAENAALKKADPLAEMWCALAEHQPFADRDGHGDTWRAMCSERTEDAAWAAARAVRNARRSAAWQAAQAAAEAASEAAHSIVFIRWAKEGR